jgi:putative tRNA adenosine deaminase-associated protein
MSHFACAMLGDRGSWRIVEVDLSGCETVDDAVELLRDFQEPVRILAVEQDDEYAALLRLDLAADEADEPARVFLSNGHAAEEYPLAAILADGLVEIGGDPLLDDEDAPPALDAAPFGDPDVVEDLGVKAPELIELSLHESTLPIDLLISVVERLGCLDEFEAVRA